MDKELKGEKEALKKALESVTTGGATDQALQVRNFTKGDHHMYL